MHADLSKPTTEPTTIERARQIASTLSNKFTGGIMDFEMIQSERLRYISFRLAGFALHLQCV